VADCFIVQEKDKIIVQEGECSAAYPPESSFKIALSLIGFDSTVFKDENNPVWGLPRGSRSLY
jgi:beta-lactamase class D OXA-29